MKIKLLFLIFLPSMVFSQIGNGFENISGFVPSFDCRYTDPSQGSGTPHILVDFDEVEGCFIAVSETGTADILGYTCMIDESSPNGSGGLSNDVFGVVSGEGITNELEDLDVAFEGEQIFAMSDTDGTVTMTFDVVDLSGMVNPVASISYFLRPSDYETEDIFKVTVLISGGCSDTINLIDTSGVDIDLSLIHI